MLDLISRVYNIYTTYRWIKSINTIPSFQHPQKKIVQEFLIFNKTIPHLAN
jgi:hypothetical protein